MSTSNVNLYAQWTPTYTVSYHGNGSTGGSAPIDSNNYLTGATVTVLGNTGSLTKTSNAFTGWNTAANGSGSGYTGGQTFPMSTSNVNLYAQWTPTYTVTYHGNGATSGSVPIDSNNYLPGAVITVLGVGNLRNDGYLFDYWTKFADGSGTHYDATDGLLMGSANVDLYAQWTLSALYTVTYDGNGKTGGTIPTDGNTYWTYQTVTVSDNTGYLRKEQVSGITYRFAGWNTAANGSGTNYTGGQTFAMGLTNVTLYANWVACTVGGLGPAGGWVFYDKGSYTNGWRYMEAAPSDWVYIRIWSPSGVWITSGNDSRNAVGQGMSNTAAFISHYGTGSDYAAQFCESYTLGGYSDWYLPSKDELYWMNVNLAQQGIGGFSGFYWSSSDTSTTKVWRTDMSNWGGGVQSEEYLKYDTSNTRAVRQF
jgi:hypothetical protein